MMKIYDILKLEECSILAHKYTPYVCRTITWAIHDDCRSFFHKKLTPQNFFTNNIRWPRSLLDDIMADVRWARPVYRPTFPVAWDDEKYDAPKTKSDLKQTPPGDKYTPPPNKGRQLKQGDTQLQQRPGDYSHMHPKLKAFFDPLLKKFEGRVRINEIMLAAGVSWRDMPKFAQDKLTGRDLLCWDNTCGICRFGSRCERPVKKFQISLWTIQSTHLCLELKNAA
jgi:hypothetical protein